MKQSVLPSLRGALFLFSIVKVTALSAGTILAADWPCWRGPARDGQVSGFVTPATWPNALKEEWKVSVGEGHASPIVVEDRAFLLTREKDEEVVRCLALSTGKELWRSQYPAPYEVNAAAQTHGAGPKSTPAAQAGKLFTLGISEILSAWDAATGDLKWRREFTQEFPKTAPLYGTAMSPLVEGGLCVAHVGGHDKGALRAFDVETGQTRWSLDGDGPGYSSPVAVDLAGERQVVTQTQSRLVGVALKTGKLLWSLPFRTEYDQNSVTCIVAGDLLITSGYGKPVTALRLQKDGLQIAAHEAWSSPDVSMFLSSPVLAGGSLFGLSMKQKGQLFSLDPVAGKVLWKGPGRAGDNVALLSAGSGSCLVLLTNDADLIFGKPTASGYEPLAKYKVASSPTWAHPVLVGKRILIKDKTSLGCFTLESKD